MCQSTLRGHFPVCTVAPPGVAAFNIHGKTIHSALRLPVQHNQHFDDFPLSSASLSSLGRLFTSVNILIIEEVSMVSSRMLEQIHLRLQAIKRNELPFGGLNVIIVGDFFQLRPIRAKFAFTHTTLWPLFTPFFLNENMRQSSDHSFAQLLNIVRIASLNPDDTKLLESR